MNRSKLSLIRMGDIVMALLIGLTLLVLTGCEGSATGPVPGSGAPVVAEVDISQGPLSLRVGQGSVLNAVARGADGRTQTTAVIEWSSSDTAVAVVSAGGEVWARGEGRATITARAGGKDDRVQVEVGAENRLERLEIAPGSLTLEPGTGAKLSLRAHLSDGTVVTGWNAEWKTSDETVAHVWPDGSVSGIRGGTATVTATLQGKSVDLAVTVSEFMVYRLARVNDGALPVVIRDSVWTDGTGATRHRKTQVASGSFKLSTLTQTYEEELVMRVWEETHYPTGTVLFSPAATIHHRDAGKAGWDEYGYRRFESATAPGRVFTATWDPGRWINAAQVVAGAGLGHFRFER